jgi:aminoglycoside phosphotransferase (APT) family kinase protein
VEEEAEAQEGDLTPPEAAQEVDLPSLCDYLRDRLPGFDSADVTVSWLSEGQSNLTFLLVTPAYRYVLRRPPTGELLPRAHDVLREARIMTALGPSAVPVPKVLATCDDVGVIGAPFFVMSYAPGSILRSRGDSQEITAEQAAASSESLVQTLADLHGADYEALGLAELGRPEGFLERQLARWHDQWARSRTGQVAAVDALSEALGRRLPRTRRSSLVHGDFRVENVVLDLDDVSSATDDRDERSRHEGIRPLGTVQAVLDWELATLGDPLTDVGWLAMYWAEPGETTILESQAVTQRDGFWSRTRLYEEYQRHTGADLTDLGFYVAFAYYKLAVIQQGIHRRFLRGDAAGARAAGSGRRVHDLAEAGLEAVTPSSRP